jgi:hypothetical protein
MHSCWFDSFTRFERSGECALLAVAPALAVASHPRIVVRRPSHGDSDDVLGPTLYPVRRSRQLPIGTRTAVTLARRHECPWSGSNSTRRVVITNIFGHQIGRAGGGLNPRLSPQRAWPPGWRPSQAHVRPRRGAAAATDSRVTPDPHRRASEPQIRHGSPAAILSSLAGLNAPAKSRS